ncbi:MAG TPA: flagellar export chaperone FlgN [Candidatus Krumholzibacteria bacterium]|nr:flagellar export chaperone FlgN [Candidatus Krumholzibacteria bacterium]HRX50893.1 flagellar export chaperone FlgN [Candidatus Krumholzibacteria bacterium]
MTTATRPSAAMLRLRDALAREVRVDAELLRTLTQQNRLLRLHDTGSLHELADAWAARQAEADGVRQRRIEAQEAAARELGLPADARLSTITERPVAGANEVRALSTALRTTVEALERQNALNDRLARFCLDLVAGEAEAVSHGLRSRSGTYDGSGALSATAGGGVITRKA